MLYFNDFFMQYIVALKKAHENIFGDSVCQRWTRWSTIIVTLYNEDRKVGSTGALAGRIVLD